MTEPGTETEPRAETEPNTAVEPACGTGNPACSRDFRHRVWEARLLGFAVAVAGLVNIISALTPSLRDRVRILHEGFSPNLSHLAAGTTALLGVALLLVGRGIAHRRRIAYLIALCFLLVSSVTHIAKGLDIEEAVVMLVLAGLLWRCRALFTEGAPRARLRSLARWIPIIVGVDFAYGLLGLWIRHGDVDPHLTPVLALHEVGARLLGFDGPLHVGFGFGLWFPDSLSYLGAFSIAAIVLLALAPVAEKTVGHHRERDRIRNLLDRDDGDTLDPFALREDKQYVFSDDGGAAVAYRYVNGVGLASGDPVGDPAGFSNAIDRFLDRCDAHGWRPAAMGSRQDRIALWTAFGLRSHYLGDEAIIDVASFTLDGRAMRGVRQAANRTQKYGIITEIHREGELDPTLRRALQGIAERHREGAKERGFSMALDALLSGRDSDCVVVVARSEDGSPMAFQRYVPCLRGRGLSLDAMRRDRVGPNGVNERMIVDAILWAKDHGIEHVSLNFAMFKGLIEEGADLSFLAGLEAWFVRRLNPYFQIESLLTFNAKFQPRWVPRYLIYRSAGDLASVGIAAASAEGFMPFDRHHPEREPQETGGASEEADTVVAGRRA